MWASPGRDRLPRADAVFAQAPTDMSHVPAAFNERCLLLTAHYGGYTAQFVALCKHLRRPLSVIVGPYPQNFCDMLRSTCARSGMDVDAIRSGMRMLRQINAALDAGRIVIGLFDVPWHKGEGAGRTMTAYPFGGGKIQGSDAMFELARRLHLPVHLSLHVRRGDAFAVRLETDVTQPDCYRILNEEFMRSPADFERLCEVHEYCTDVVPIAETILFSAKERHFALSADSLKAYEFDLQSDSFAGLKNEASVELAKLAALEKRLRPEARTAGGDLNADLPFPAAAPAQRAAAVRPASHGASGAKAPVPVGHPGLDGPAGDCRRVVALDGAAAASC